MILWIQILELDTLFLHLILGKLGAGDRGRVICNFSCEMQLQWVKRRERDYVYRSMRQKEQFYITKELKCSDGDRSVQCMFVTSKLHEADTPIGTSA